MSGGLRPYSLTPLNRGCVEKIAVTFTKNCNQLDKTGKQFYLTAKTHPWDNVADDSDAVFKVTGLIPNPTKEPGRVEFYLGESDTYLDPTVLYYCDIVETNISGPPQPRRVFIGNFNVLGGANNAQAGGQI